MPGENTVGTKPIPALPIPESYWVITGKLLAGEYPGVPFAPEITRQRLDAFIEAGITTFINLTRPGESEDYSALMHEQAAYHAVHYAQHDVVEMECLSFPIEDYNLPEISLMSEILNAIDHALAQGRKVYVHCNGGIGRTGTTVGCFLVRHGRTGPQALRELAGWWEQVPKSARHPHSPETVRQEEFVLNWAGYENRAKEL